MDKKKEEKLLNQIRKLAKIAENKQCADCPERLPPYVNLTHYTFVCTNCSGIHREFAHKLKSISLSTFTEDDVKGLKEGGNEACRKVYLENWDPADFHPPKSGDNARIREWIRKKYVEKRWHRDNSAISGGNSSRNEKTSLSSRRLSNSDGGKGKESKEKNQVTKRKSMQQSENNDEKYEKNNRSRGSVLQIAPPKKDSAVSEPVLDLLDFTDNTSPSTTIATTNSTNGHTGGNDNTNDVFGEDPFANSDPFGADPFAGSGTGANFSVPPPNFGSFGQPNTVSNQVSSNGNVFGNTFPVPSQQQQVFANNNENFGFNQAPQVSGVNPNQVTTSNNNNNGNQFPLGLNTGVNPQPTSENPSPFTFSIRPQQEPVENKPEPIKTLSIDEAFSGLEIEERERRLSISASGGDPSISTMTFVVGETCIFTNSQGQSWYARVENVTNDNYTPYVIRLQTGQTKETDQHHLKKMPPRRPSQGQATQYVQQAGSQYPGSNGVYVQSQPNGIPQGVVPDNKPVDAFADLNPSQLSGLTTKSSIVSNNMIDNNNPFANFVSSPSSVTQSTTPSNTQLYGNQPFQQQHQQQQQGYIEAYSQFGQQQRSSFTGAYNTNTAHQIQNMQPQQVSQPYTQSATQGTTDGNPFLSVRSNEPQQSHSGNQASNNPFDMF